MKVNIHYVEIRTPQFGIFYSSTAFLYIVPLA